MFKATEHRAIPYLDLVSWVFGNSDYDHTKPIFIDAHDPTHTISHDEAKTCVKKLIAGLQAQGCLPGDTVCLHSYNHIHYSMLFLAIIGAGARFHGSNPGHTTFELTYNFKVSEVKFIIVELGLLENMLLVVDEMGLPRSNVLTFDGDLRSVKYGCRPWTDLLLHGEADWITFDNEAKAKNTIAALLTTSGTTGLPKSAVISHYAFVSQGVMLQAFEDKPYEVKRLLCLPQFHAFASPLSHLTPLREGHTVYLMRRYQPESFVAYLHQYQITEVALVNPIVMNLLRLPAFKRELLLSLRFAWVAGAPLDASTQNQLSSILHEDAIVCQVWGMTEIGWITTLRYPERDRTGSVGRLLPNVEARLVDKSLNEINGNGTWGEILIKSPSMMTSYLKNLDATDSTILGGWLRTGDIGYQNGGKWYIIDRAKDLIKVRGWQVSPTQLEACLLTHSAVIDVAIIGVDLHDGRGELPRAYVVLDPRVADTIEDKEIHAHLNGRLAKYKAISGGVRRMRAIPRSENGKILKKVLRDLARIEIGESPGSQGVDVSETSGIPETHEAPE